MNISNNITLSDEIVSLIVYICHKEKIEPNTAVKRAFALLKIHSEIDQNCTLAIINNENEKILKLIK